MVSVRLIARFVCVGSLAALTACGFARVPYESGQQSSQSSGPCNSSAGAAGDVRVCPGDTLIGLSREHNVTVLGLMRANNLATDKILVGQRLTLPDETVHVVQPGDQLLGIANRYGVSYDNLVAANELKRPYTIFPEQRLAIPRGPVDRQVAAGGVSTERLPESQPVTNQAPSGPVIIGSGAPPMAAPQSAPPVAAREEQAPPVQTSEAPAPTGEASASKPRPRNRPAPVASAPPAEAAKPAASKTESKPAAAAQGGFLLPVQGRIVSEFGPKSGGLHNDGINIAAPRGTPILATADGEIAYAGDGLPGFGNLILIRHDDGWTSAYAHAESMAIKRGDAVKRGDAIGAVGSTGSVPEPQLHFELRKHDRAVDPKPLLGP